MYSWTRSPPLPAAQPKKIACFAVALMMLVTRRLDQMLVPQFYAEDGTVFFAQAEVAGWESLWLPHSTYFLLIMRIIAWLFSPLPWEYLPLAYNLAAAAVTAGIAVRVLLAKIPPWAAWVGAAAVIALPSAGEQFLNLCCLHFVLAILITVNLIEAAPIGREV